MKYLFFLLFYFYKKTMEGKKSTIVMTTGVEPLAKMSRGFIKNNIEYEIITRYNENVAMVKFWSITDELKDIVEIESHMIFYVVNREHKLMTFAINKKRGSTCASDKFKRFNWNKAKAIRFFNKYSFQDLCESIDPENENMNSFKKVLKGCQRWLY